MKSRPEDIPLRAGETRHSVMLERREVSFVLRRSARRTLALRVDRGALRVTVPRATPMRAVASFVEANSAWVLARLESSAAALAARRLEVVDGAEVGVLGAPVRLRLPVGRRRSAWAHAGDGVEELLLPPSNGLPALERALRARALARFEARVAEFCLRLGVAAPRVALSSATTRWGSCSLRSGIRLHWKLALMSPAVADYVVAHEVAHLREMNHSARFWQHVATLCPDWRALRVRLREEGRALPEFVISAPSDGDCQEEAA